MKRLCEEHGTTLYNAKLLILGGRKTCYVLDYGRINSTSCFHQINKQGFSPTKTKTNEWILIPDGWKVAFKFEKKQWIGQVKYFDSVPKYSFSDAEQNEQQKWFKNPSRAFNEILQKEKYRHNGQLLIGVGYDTPQEKLRQVFKDFQCESTTIQEIFTIWLSGKTMSPIIKKPRLFLETKLKDTEMIHIIRKISPLTDSKYVTWIYEALDKQFLTKTEFLNFLRKTERALEQSKEDPNSLSIEDPKVLTYVIRLLREVTFLPQRLPKADQIEYITNETF